MTSPGSFLRSRLRGAFAVLGVVASVFTASVAVAPSAQAATFRSFSPPRYQTNDNGAIEMIGNHNQTCTNTGGPATPTCAALLNSNAVGHNQTLPMIQLDADNGVLSAAASGQTTLNSSSADLNLPAGSTVLFAGLYWSGSAPTSVANRDKVQFFGPGSTAYTPVTATQLDTDGVGNAYYQGFLDVTSTVVAKGNGTYWVGDVKSNASSNTYAGWSMVVVLQNSIYPVRNLSVFDGFGRVANNAADSILDIPIGPFLTPPNGTVNASVGFVAWEGDATITGDKALFKNGPATAATPNTSFTTLADATSPANDFFNSSIAKNGINVSSRNPNNVNNLGVDIDQLAIPGLLPNGATDATIRLTSAGDTILPGVVTFAVDLYTPSFPSITKSVVDLNGGTTVPGDLLEYAITMNNTGQDPATNSVFTDILPPNTTFVPGSITATGTVFGSYDAANNRVLAYVGTGATSTTGGTLNPNESFTIKFQVKVLTAAAGTVVHNQGKLDYTAKTLNKPFSFKTNITDTPVEDVADISIVKSGSPSPVPAGGTLTYTLTVGNAGPNAASSTVVTDKLPIGLTFVSASPASANCTFASPTVTCNLGTLAVGAAPVITIVATTDPTLASGSSLANTASITSATLDQVPANNSSAISTPVVTQADLSVTKSASPTIPVPGSTATYTITVTNAGPSVARSVQLSDSLPTNFTATSITASSGTCTLATKSCALGDVIVGASGNVTVTVVGMVTAAATGSITNSATASSSTTDPTPGNNTGTVTSTLSPKAELKVTKTASASTVAAGAPLTYTVTVENQGPSVAQAVSLTDTLPAGFAASAISSTAGTCTLGTASCSLGDLGVGITTITIVGTVSASFAGTSLANSATATSTTPDPGAQPNTASVTIPVTKSADLELVKTVSPSSGLVAGQTVTYKVTVTNRGPSDAQTVSISDPIPSQITLSSYTGCSLSAGTVTCAIATLANGASQTFTFVGTVNAGFTGTSLSNTASVSSATPDPGVYPNSAAVTSTVAQQADMKITKTGAPDPVVAGTNVTYTLVVTNDGPSVASGIVVDDTLPAGIVPTSATAPCTISVATNNVSCSYASLASGASQTITIVAAVSADAAAGSLSNTATVSAATPGDPTPSNNSATFVSTLQRSADLAVTKTPASQSVAAGNNATWTVSVTNAGPSSATGAQIQDTLPAGMTFVSATGPSGVTCTESGGVVICPVGTVAPNAPTISVTVVAKLAASTPTGTSLTNKASVSSTTPDPTPGNNTASAAVMSMTSADLAVRKSVSPTSVQAGGTATWTVVVTNNGPSDAQSVSVSDAIPSGFTATSMSSNVGSCVVSTGVCTIGVLAAGSSATIQMTGTLAAGYSPTTMTNSATASSTTPDPFSGNNTGTAVANVTKLVDLMVSKSGSPNPVVAGDPITYTITLSNGGPSTATSVVLTDPIPTDVTSPTTSSSGCAIASGTLTCNYATLAPGTPVIITVTGVVSAAANVGTLSNTASAWSATPEATPGDNSSTAALAVTARADLSIAKSADTSPAFVGDVFSWTIGVSNSGPSTSRNVTVTDTLPSAMIATTAVATTSAGSCSISGATVTCALGDVAAGAVVAIKVSAKIDPTTPAGSLANTSTVSSTTPDPSLANNSSTATVPMERLANFRLTKTATPSPVRAGNSITWTVTIVNDGPSTAEATNVAETLPTGITGVTYAPSQGTCSGASCNLGVLAPLATATITIAATVTANFTAGSISNTAKVTSSTPDATVANNTATVTTPVVQEADLAVTKSVSPSSFTAGSPATYRLDVTNAGPSDAAAAVTNDVLPMGVTYVSATPSVGGPCTYTASSRDVACPLGIVAPGATPFVTINVLVGVSLAAGSTTSNTGTVSSPTTDPSTSNNSSTISTPAASIADLTITKTASPSPFVPGSTGTYTITVSNAGPSLATAVQVSDPVPSGFTVTGASATAGTCTAGTTVACSLGTIAPNQSVTVTVTGTIASAQTTSLTNTATVSTAATDPTPNDHSASVTTPVAPSADVRILKTVDRANVRAGEPLTYTLLVTNGGPSTAAAVSVVDTPPTGIILTAITSPVGSCTASGATRTCALGSLAPGASVTITVAATVDPAQAAGTLTNSSTANSASTPDPTPANNTSTVPVTVSVAADVAVSKSMSPTALVAGQPVTYTINVMNNGPSTATGVALSDPMPTGITATSATGVPGCVVGGTVTCPIGTLAPGASVTVVITADVSAAATSGTSINTASSTATSPDPTAGNNTSSATGNLTSAADLSLVKTATPEPVIAGNTITYRLALHNAGPSNATGVVIADTLPFGILPNTATWPAGSCTITGRDVSCAISTVPNGGDVVVTIVATVGAGLAAGAASNTGTVSSSTPDPAMGNNSSTVVSTIKRSADIVAAKTVSAPSAAAGSTVTYHLSVTNNGPSTSETTQLTDTLPAGVTVVSVTPTGGTCVTSGATITCDGGTMAVEGQLSVDVVVRIDAATPTGTLTNNVMASSSTPDPVAANNAASVPLSVTVAADLKVTKTPSTTTLRAGEPLTWTITVSNLGPSDAQAVVVTDTVPAGFTVASITPSLGSCTGATCSINTLAAGSTATVVISGSVDSNVTSSPITNSVSVASNTPDPLSANNTASSPVTVTTNADLRLTKSASPSTVTAGQTITWTIVVNNDGPSDALAATVTDVVPAGVTDVVVTPSAGTCSGSSCSLGTMVAGTSATITITGTVDAGYSAATVDNTASITSTTSDANTTNNAASVSTPIVALADISVVKSGPTTIVAGTTISWTLVVHNAGPSVARNVSLGDPIPAGVNGTTAIATAGTCGGQVSCTLGDVAPGVDVTIAVTGTVASGAVGPLVNTATVSSPTPDPDETDRTSTVTTDVTASADVKVTKTVTPDPVRAGEAATWTITVTNLGPSDAQGVTLADTLPAVVLTATLVPSQGTCGNTDCAFGAIAAGSSATVTVRGIVDPGAAAGPITNSATATSSTSDPTPGNNTGAVTSNVVRAADLSIVKTASPEPVRAGDPVTYTLTVTNAGPSSAEAVSVSDPIPAGVTVASLPADCSQSSGTVTCTSPALAVGATVSFSLVGTFDPALTLGSTLRNAATVSSATPDPNTGNNTSAVNSTVDTAADLSITKSVSPSPLVPGSAATYTIVVGNAGPSVASAASVTDNLPADFVAASVTSTVGSCTGSTSVSCALGDVAPGATVTITVTGSVVPGVTSPVTNTVTVSSATFDPAPSDNSATITTPVAPRADLTVLKEVLTSPVVAGQPVQFRIKVSNAGPSTAKAVGVGDVIASPLLYQSSSTSLGSCTEASGTVSCSLGDLAPGVEAVIFITADPPSNATGSIANTAAATTATHQSDTSNDSSTVTAPIMATANLDIAKSMSPDPVPVGGAVTYTITVHNGGPSDAVNVVVTDSFATGITPGTPSDTACSVVGQDVTCTWPTLANGATTIVTIPATVSPSLLAGAVANTATVSSPTDPAGPKSATVKANLLTQADLSLVKSVSPTSAKAGQPITYTLTVKNSGPADAGAPSVVDSLPAGIVPSSARFTVPSLGTCTISGQTVTCTFAAVMSVGASATISIPATVDSTHAPGSVDNAATASSTTEDPTLSNNTGRAPISITRSADVRIAKTAVAGTVIAGSTVAWDLVVVNDGPSSAEATSVSDAMPAGAHVVSATITSSTGLTGTSSCTSASDVVTCALGTVAPAGTATIHIEAQLDSSIADGSALNNQGTVATATPDPTPANNSSVARVTVRATADLGMVKSVDNATANAGESIVYTLTVTNYGPSDALNIAISDTLPTSLAVGTPMASVGTCTVTASVLNCSAPSLASGSVMTIQIPATIVSTTTPGPLTNTASVTSTTTEIAGPGAHGNTGSATTAVTASSSLSIAKVAVGGPFVAGTVATWTLTVTNGGPSAAQTVSVTDAMPAGVSGWTAVPSQGSCVSASCDLGTIDAGDTITITVTGTIAANYAAADVTNTATVASPTNPTTPAPATVTTPVVTRADLSIVKTSTPTAVIAGQSISWTITVTNAGPSDAQAVTVADALPTNVSITSVMPQQGTCTGSLDCALGVVPAGATVTVTITGIVDSDTKDTFVSNTATVNSPTPDPDTTDRTATIVTPISTQAALSVTKMANTSPIVPGQSVSWTITVTNAGPSTARFVEVADNLPSASLSGVALAPSQGTCSADGSCLLGDLTAGSTIIIAVTATVNADVTDPSLTNSVGVQSTTPHGADPIASVTTSVAPRADLHITKRGAPNPVVAGQDVTWTINVRNDGPSNAVGVVISDQLPTDLVMVDQGPCSGPTSGSGVNVYDCSMGIVPVGTTVSVTLVSRVPATSLLTAATNNASVSSATADPDNTDNATTAQVPVVTSADLTVVKTITPNPVVAGSSVTWTIAVTNAGPSVARAVRVNDALPSGIAGVTATPQQGVCTVTSTLACDLTDIAPGTTVNVVVSATVLADYVSASLDNTASVSSSTPDPVLDNTGSVSAPATTSADLSLTKAGPATVVAGTTISWTLTVANAGPSNAQSVTVDDVLPAGVAFVSASTSQGSCIGSLHCELAVVRPGVPVTITVNGSVDANYLGANIVNQASLSSPTADPTPADHTATKLTNVTTSADLSITKVATPSPAVPGTPLTWVVTVHNAGPSVARAVEMTETLPAGIHDVTLLPGQGTCTTSGLCSLGDIRPGEIAVITVSSTVDANLTTALSNTASVVSSTPLTNTADDTVTLSTPVLPQADVSITKTGPGGAVVPGAPVTWTIVADNAGPSVARNVVVTDVLPASLQPGTAATTPTGTCTITSGTLTCNLGAMNPATSVTITVTGVLASGAVNPTLDNTATISSPDDSTPGNNSSNASNPTSPDPDLKVTIVPSTTNVVAGQPLGFTITVANLGVSDAANSVLTFVVPAGYILQSGGGCIVSGGVAICSLGTMLPGATRTFNLVGVVSAGYLGGSMALTANVSTTTHETYTADNSATATVASVGNADLALTKTANIATATFGDIVSYTIDLVNNGPSVAPNATIVDELPPALDATSAIAPGATCSTEVHRVVCVSNSLAVGDHIIATVTAKVVATGSLTNTASATATLTGTSTRPSAQAVVAVPSAARLRITKAVDTSTAKVNDVVTYQITVSNNGPDAATSVVVDEPLNAALELQSTATIDGSFDAATKHWNIGTLANGQTARLTVKAKILSVGPIVNVVTAVGTNVLSAQSTVRADATVEATLATPLKLPVSGADSLLLIRIAVGLLLPGIALLLIDRRRRSPNQPAN